MRHDTELKDYLSEFVKVKEGNPPVAGVYDYDTVYKVVRTYEDKSLLGLSKIEGSNDTAAIIVPVTRVELVYRGVMPNIDTLMLLRDFELNEMLLTVNAANTREIVRKLLRAVRERDNHIEYQEGKIDRLERRHQRIVDVVEEGL